jgi:predicted amidohydrolase YtcJ
MAIRDGRILAVGEDAAIRELGARADRTIDLEGRLVLPGLTDSHFHCQKWALGLRRLRLADAESREDVKQRLRAAARGTPEGKWIQGQGWNEGAWPSNALLSGSELDEAAPLHPVILWRSDLHLAVVNSEALRLAGITRDTPDPPQGLIDRDRSGKATGVLREKAVDLVAEKIPVPKEAEMLEAMRAGFPELLRLGLTGIHDFLPSGRHDGLSALHAYQHLEGGGELPIRVWASIPAAELEEALGQGLRTGWGEGRLRIGHVKLFSDGSQGARTAWMLEPYQDSDGAGMPLWEMAELAVIVRRAEEGGFAVAIHAIGDRANRELVGMFERVKADRKDEVANRLAAPHRIEHVQNIRPEDILRLAALDVVGSVQPIHIRDDITMIEQSVGRRAQHAYPFRQLMDAGVSLAMGSDCPVADPNPFCGIHAAVTRQRHDGTPESGWYAEQRLTVAEAVKGYTMGAAIASGRQAEMGSITPGKLADAIVLDRDIFAVDPDQIAEAQLVMCVFDGCVVVER